MKLRLAWLRHLFMTAGVGLFFAGERYFSSESYHTWFRVLGIALASLSIVTTLAHVGKAKKAGYPEEARQITKLLGWQLPLLMSVVIYCGYWASLPDTLVPTSLMSKLLLGVWVVLAITGIFAMIGLEFNLSKAGSAAQADSRRVARGGVSWATIGLLVAALIGFNFFGAKKDKTYDLTYLKVTTPSRGTINLLQTLSKDLEIVAFFPEFSEVKPLVKEYTDAVAKASPHIKLRYEDKDLNPTIGKEYKVIQNGMIALRFEGATEQVTIGTQLNKARSNIKKLDNLMQKAITQLTAKEKIVYFTQAHGEMMGFSGSEPERSVKGLNQILQSQRFTIKKLDDKNGLLTEIPSDATILAIIGPTSAFLKEEVETIKAFVDKGGSLLVTLDDETINPNQIIKPDANPLIDYLKSTGLIYDPTMLGNTQRYVANTKTAVDIWFLYSNVFGSHPATETLSQHDQKLQVLFYQSGSFASQKVEGWKSAEIVKTFGGTFRDLNRNYKQDDNEKLDRGSFAAASEKTVSEGKVARIIAIADANVFSDFLLGNIGNQVMVLDSFKWLANDSAIATSQTSEEDVKIMHSNAKHLYVFYGSVLLVPSAVLLTGFVATRRRSRRTRA